jgi:hypothetical protein
VRSLALVEGVGRAEAHLGTGTIVRAHSQAADVRALQEYALAVRPVRVVVKGRDVRANERQGDPAGRVERHDAEGVEPVLAIREHLRAEVILHAVFVQVVPVEERRRSEVAEVGVGRSLGKVRDQLEAQSDAVRWRLTLDRHLAVDLPGVRLGAVPHVVDVDGGLADKHSGRRLKELADSLDRVVRGGVRHHRLRPGRNLPYVDPGRRRDREQPLSLPVGAGSGECEPVALSRAYRLEVERRRPLAHWSRACRHPRTPPVARPFTIPR